MAGLAFLDQIVRAGALGADEAFALATRLTGRAADAAGLAGAEVLLVGATGQRGVGLGAEVGLAGAALALLT